MQLRLNVICKDVECEFVNPNFNLIKVVFCKNNLVGPKTSHGLWLIWSALCTWSLLRLTSAYMIDRCRSIVHIVFIAYRSSCVIDRTHRIRCLSCSVHTKIRSSFQKIIFNMSTGQLLSKT